MNIHEDFSGNFNEFVITRQHKGDNEKVIIKSFDTHDEAVEFLDGIPKDDNNTYEIHKTRQAMNDSRILGWQKGHHAAIGELNLNDGHTHYSIDDPISDSKGLEKALAEKYPSSTIVRDGDNIFTMTSKDGSEVATVVTHNGKHTITVQRRINEDTLSESIKGLLNTLLESKTNPYFTWSKYRKDEREHDEYEDAPLPQSNKRPKPKPFQTKPNTHYAVLHSDVDTSSYKHILTNSAGERLIPVTTDHHDKFHGVGSYSMNMNRGMVSDEVHRKMMRNEVTKDILSSNGIHRGTISDIRDSKEPEVLDHFAILHVPTNSVPHMGMLKQINISPKGRFYVKVPKHVYDDYMHGIQHNIMGTKKGKGDLYIEQANRKVGSRTGWDELNHIMNPNKNSSNPNISKSHEIRIETVLSPKDIADMRKAK